MNRKLSIAAISCCLTLMGSASAQEDAKESRSEEQPSSHCQSLFDGRTLDGWQVLEDKTFKRHGKVEVIDGRIVLEAGSPATGVRYTGEVPTTNYEVSLDAMRVEGNDFFCGLTFPVSEMPCTLIVGGWGGGVVGLSNVDGQPAVENETTNFLKFDAGRWYHIRVRVTDERIAAWIDDEQVVDLALEKHKFSVWWEQEPVRPLGVATWYTKAALKDIRLERLDAMEIASADDEDAAASDIQREDVPTASLDDCSWTSLFDGRTLGQWKDSAFGGGGGIEVREERIEIGFADGCNGVTWTGEFPRLDYEIQLEAQRVNGNDFFCGLTIPVGEDPCSLIVGGWGGAIVGLSSIDGLDANRNETRRVMGFDEGRWYRIRLRVTKERIQAWIDDKQMVDQAIEGRKISIRPEVGPSRPLGISSWCTTAALRDIKYRRVSTPAASEPAESP